MDYISANLSGALSAKQLAAEIQKLKISKQDTLKDKENIKTINEQSVLGEGDLKITEAKLEKSLVATMSIGGVEAGTVFPAGTSIEVILRDLFKTTVHFVMYFGISKEQPMEILDSFTKVAIPADLTDVGAEYFYTTADGTEEGNYCVYAYPTTYGKLSHIYCNGLTMFDLINEWEVITINHNGDTFFLYYSKNPTKDEDSKYQFVFEK